MEIHLKYSRTRMYPHTIDVTAYLPTQHGQQSIAVVVGDYVADVVEHQGALRRQRSQLAWLCHSG